VTALLTDELEIRRVLALYCHRCDDGDFDALLDLFASDGEFVYGARACRGRGELRAFFDEMQGTPAQRGKHLTLNSVLEIEGDRAMAVSDFLFLRFVDGALTPVYTGRYRDLFARVEHRWRITRREVKRDLPPAAP
jgi:3-phenylpropionate/cinnamic acid dioxygenase small subunit